MSRTPILQPQPTEVRDGERGQTMVEYGLLISFISVALIVVLGVTGFGGGLLAFYGGISAAIVAAL